MSDVSKAATRTLPGSNGRVAISGSRQTIDLSAYEGQWVGLQTAGTAANFLAYKTQADADADTTVSATHGVNRGFELADGTLEEFYVTDNKKFLRLLGASSGDLYVWDLGSK